MLVGVVFAQRPLLILFMLPIILSAYVGGLWSGLVSTLVASVSVDYFLIPPIHSLQIAETHDFIQWLILIVNGVLISGLSESLQRSQQRVAERTAELSKTNRALRTISDCNQVLVRAESEADLLDQICRIIVETGGYRMAWVGFAGQDEARTVRPVAWAGFVEGFLDAVRVSWDDTEHGRAPMGVAVRTSEPHIARVADHLAYPTWRDEALRRGYAACLALPLNSGGRAFGGLGILAAEPEAFDPAETKLLTELANDLAYGIAALRTRAAHAQAEEALRRSERRFRALVENSGMLINLINREGVLIYVSPSSARVVGYAPEEMVGRRAVEFLHPDEIGDKERPFARMFRNPGVTLKVERRVLHKDGAWRWVEGYSTNLIDDPAVGALVFNYRDVTDRKLAEEALRESEGRYRSLFENMLNGFAYCQMLFENNLPQDFIYLDVNTAFETLTGLKNVIGKKVTEVIPGIRESNPELFEIYGRVAMAGQPEWFETYLESLGIWFSISVYSPRKGHFVAVFDNITERKRAEAALRASEQKFSILFEKAAFAAALSRLPNGVIVDVNEAFEKGFGYARQEALGRTSLELGVNPDAEGRARILADLQARGAVRDMELTLLTKSRGARAFLMNIDLVDIGGEKYVLQTAQDITDRKLAEAQLRETLVKLERNNRELQDFAYVASHDLQEPLRKIQAFGDRLKKHAPTALDEKGRDYLERMQTAAARMQTLINDLLAFSRVTTKAQPFMFTDLALAAREALADLDLRIERSGGRVEVGELHAIEADPTQLRQIFQNLIGNALKFHTPGEPPRVKVHSEIEGGLCRIFVADHGIGFDEKYLDRIFTPFQRLHGRGEYEGTGIGLAIVRKIAERHGGSVTARSAPGRGATFIVTLPVKPDARS
jgi:PAS domain S-box-containing protein